MDIAQLIWINTIVLVVIGMLVLVFLFGISRELRKTAEAVGCVEGLHTGYSAAPVDRCKETMEERLIIITVYEPDPNRWAPDFRKRK